MEYEKIILEMLNRIKVLEEKVDALSDGEKIETNTIKTLDIKNYINSLKINAKNEGKDYIILRANDIHKDLKLKSRMPAVCNAMKQLKLDDDIVLHETPSGFSSTYEIKYFVKNI